MTEEIRIYKESLYLNNKGVSEHNNLMELILDAQNIEFAYKDLKSNEGSYTAGVDGLEIDDIAMPMDKMVDMVRERFYALEFDKVKKVYIKKDNGKLRPLGIPTIIDRLLEKCVVLVLEPILESKFHDNSFGFRPRRSAGHAISRLGIYVNAGYKYSVDLDIEGFFDNVDHGKLRRQLWSIGIRDEFLLKWISKKLKGTVVEPDGTVRKVTKGTPQGGIISPLLANVVLNEFDYWLASQWCDYKNDKKKPSGKQNYEKYKKSKLKRIFFVRYADDVKIVTDNYTSAIKIRYACIDWLNKRLKLQCNKDKTVIRNINKGRSDYLGVSLVGNDRGYMSTKMSKKSVNKCVNTLRIALNEIKEKQNRESIISYNRKIMGMHNYYCMCTRISKDFAKIYWRVRRLYLNAFERFCKRTNGYPKFYKDVGVGYAGYTSELYVYKNLPIINPYTVRWVKSKSGQLKKSIKENPYIKIEDMTLQYNINALLNSKILNRSEVYIVNRAIRYGNVQGKCELTGKKLSVSDVNCHHKIPVEKGGNDEYDNLMIIHKDAHKIIHYSDYEELLERFNLKDTKQLRDKYVGIINLL